jgi:hypothetical protein
LEKWSIFQFLKLPAARKEGRQPIFLDFTINFFPGENSLAQIMDEIMTKSRNLIDGVILSPNMLSRAIPADGKELWVRADSVFGFLHQNKSEKSFTSFSIDPRDWIKHGISGVVGTLMLGSPASIEADNIQNLALLRSRCLDLGLNYVIDLHTSKKLPEKTINIEVVELGLNLAVELGGDIAILPSMDCFLRSDHIEKIAALPVFTRMSTIDVASKYQPSAVRTVYPKALDGIVITNLQDWRVLFDDGYLLKSWSKSLRFAPVEGLK